MRGFIDHSVIVCALVILAASPARAQEQRASLEGIIRDTSGAVLPGVTVEAKSLANTGVISTTSDESGIYRFPALRPGAYQVTASLSGFTSKRAERVVLELGQVITLDLALGIGGVAEAIQVTSEAPLIDVKQNAASVSITRELIDRIPKGRDFTSLVAASAPGAQSESRNGGIQIDGASGSENRYVIDGMDTTAIRSGVSNKELKTDFVAEVQVKSSGYNAEYRAATGGVVSAITRSGTNQWHGTGGLYYDSNRLRQGTLRPSLRLNPSDQRIAEYVTTTPDTFREVEPVVDLGGPVLRDRLWFYVGYSPTLDRTARTVTFRANQQTGTFVTESPEHNAYWNLTGQLNSNLRLRVSGINERTRGDITLPGIEPDGTSTSNPAQFPQTARTDSFNDLYSGVLDWVLSSQTYVNVTMGYLGYGSRGKNPANLGTRRVFQASNLTFPEIPASLRNVNGYSDFASNSFTALDDFSRFGLNAEITRYASWNGRHTFKAGAQFETIENSVDSGNQAPNILLYWNTGINTNDGRANVRGPYGYYRVRRSFTEGSISTTNVGIFVQDSWQVSDRLTLNLGVRTEKEDVPSYREENPGIKFGFGDKVAPRAGFAWDVNGTGSWKIYGSWGMFYDLTKLEMPRGSFGADRWVDYFYTLDTFDWPSIDCAYPPVSGPGCPGTFIQQIDFRLPSNSAQNSDIDPALKPIRSQELIVGLDRELTKTMSLSVRYARKHLERTIEDVGVITDIGERFFISNPGFGLTEFTLGQDYPRQPRAKRDYDGLEFRLRKRFSDNWQVTTSYTYSRIYGNYSGLASSDENGRTSPNVNRFFDGLYNSFDVNGTPVEGRLGTDRPHAFKLLGSYDLKWGTSVGLDYLLESGYPVSREITYKGIPVFDQGRGSLGRTPVYSRTNMQVQQMFRLARHRFTATVEAFNVFNQDTATSFYFRPYRDGFSFADDRVFFAGWNPDAAAAANAAIRPDPRYRLNDGFLGRRSYRLSVRYTF